MGVVRRTHRGRAALPRYREMHVHLIVHLLTCAGMRADIRTFANRRIAGCVRQPPPGNPTSELLASWATGDSIWPQFGGIVQPIALCSNNEAGGTTGNLGRRLNAIPETQPVQAWLLS